MKKKIKESEFKKDGRLVFSVKDIVRDGGDDPGYYDPLTPINDSCHSFDELMKMCNIKNAITLKDIIERSKSPNKKPKKKVTASKGGNK
jgi:hypothetical protein